jgi:hypothetical protein
VLSGSYDPLASRVTGAPTAAADGTDALTTGALWPQADTVTVKKTGGELRLVLSVTTNWNSYDPATSGTNEGDDAFGELSVALLPAGWLITQA